MIYRQSPLSNFEAGLKKASLVYFWVLLLVLGLACRGWSQDQIKKLTPSHVLLPPTPEEIFGFGYSVAVWQDWIIVSSSSADQSKGALYVYDAVSGQQIRKFKPTITTQFPGFGKSMAVSENRLLVGAWREEAAYLYALPSFELIRKFEPAPANGGSRAGWSVALSGNRALMGAYRGAAANGERSGVAYLFDTESGQQISALEPPNPANDERFAWSVALSNSRAIVGEWGSDRFTGTVFYFDRVSGDLQTTITAPIQRASFGIAVAADEETVLIGANRSDEASGDAGSVYFDRTIGANELERITPLSIDSKLFGDTIATYQGMALIGADRSLVENLRDVGSAFLIDVASGDQLFEFTLEEPIAFEQLGNTLALSNRFVALGTGRGFATEIEPNKVYVYALKQGVSVEAINGPQIRRQTGLLEQQIRITNRDQTPINGFRLEVTDIPAGVTLFNQSGPKATLDFPIQLPHGESRVITLEFFSPARSSDFTPSFSILEASVDAHQKGDPSGLEVDRIVILEDRSTMIEFQSIPETIYEVQSTNENGEWVTSPIKILAASDRTRWIDRGPPKTTSHPSEQPSRLYRIKVSP